MKEVRLEFIVPVLSQYRKSVTIKAENRSVDAKGWGWGMGLTTMTQEGVWGSDVILLYLDCLVLE